MPEDLLFSIAPYPLRIIEPVASSWSIESTKYTYWGRTELHIRDGEERRRHLEGLTTAIGVEIQQIDERKQELLKERAKMKVVMAVFEEYKQKMREKEEEEAKLEKEVDDMRTNPVIRKAMMHINTTGKGRLSNGSVSAFTPAIERSSTPASVRSPMLASFQNERPPLFSRDSSPDDLLQSPPKDDEVMDEEKEED